MNLYLKYRPKTIDELDLAGVREALTQMVKSGNVGHAYLLTGPRGAGKTSTARILGRIVNCEKHGDKLGEPCNDCEACKSILDSSAMDVIEIDAASNRGIDDIRELKEKIRLAPAKLKRKVYIIDEVHMLTTEAFNALLKTLEEPPSRSLFILCTTELHKVPETIVSRCSRIQFTKATPEEMQRSFKRVIEGEGKSVTAEALQYLAKSVDGSFRDGVKILDQVLGNSDKVELADIEKVVSGSSSYQVKKLVEALVAKNLESALANLAESLNQGVDLNFLLLSLMRALRDKLLANDIEIAASKLIFALDDVSRRLSSSLDGELLIQVVFVEWCGTTDGGNNQKPIINNQEKAEIAEVMKSQKLQGEQSSDRSPKIAQGSELREQPMGTEDAGAVWKQVVGSLGSNNLALDTILSKARPGNIQGDELTVFVQYDFHKQQLMSEKNRVKFEELITRVVGRNMKVRCEVAASPSASQAQVPSAHGGNPGDTIEDAIAIFS